MVKTIYKFYANWCGPCRVMAANLKNANLDGIDLEEIDIESEENEQIVADNRIRNIPVTIFYDENDNVVERIAGIITTDKINEIIDRYGRE